MKKHRRGLQNQALQTFGPDPVSDRILGRFWEQIGANFGSKIEQKSIEKLSEDQMCATRVPRGSRRAFLHPLAPIHPAHFDLRGGGRGRGKPLPRGSSLNSLNFESRSLRLNHLAQRAGGINNSRQIQASRPGSSFHKGC